MNILYEGVDITNRIEVNKADIFDNAGGNADSIELIFADTEGFWSKWKPQKGHKIEVKEEGYSSGLMYVDHLEQVRGKFIIKGLSTPPDAKTVNTRSWEKVGFLKFAKDIADKYGFQLQAYGIVDYKYERVDQIERADFEFLAYRCMLEGYMLKISNQKVIIYDEKYMESQDPARTVYLDELDGDYNFKSISVGLFNSCQVYSNSSSGFIKSEFKPSSDSPGPVLKRDIFVNSQAEADRYSRGLLRAVNKYESTGRIQIEISSKITAGNNINMDRIGFANGKYFIEQAVHRLVNRKSIFKLRKPLEGY